MKLSQMTTDEATSVLIELTPHVASICTDVELKEELEARLDIQAGASRAEIYNEVINKITKLIPIIIGKQKESVYSIIGILNGKTVDEIGKQNFIVTGMQIRDIVKDKELIAFFRSCMD